MFKSGILVIHTFLNRLLKYTAVGYCDSLQKPSVRAFDILFIVLLCTCNSWYCTVQYAPSQSTAWK